MNIRFRVDLSEAPRAELTALLNGAKHAARKIKTAQILLASDAGVSNEVIASSVSVGGSKVYRTKRRFVEGNRGMVLSEDPRLGAARNLSVKEAGFLIATTWSKSLDVPLAEEMVRLTEHENLLRETVRQRLARTISSRGAGTCGAFHR